MSIEIEAKFRLSDPAGMRRRLADARAKALESVLEYNTYYDTPEGRLRQNDRGIRVRILQGADGSRRAEMTYKGPRRPGAMKTRQEEQMGIDSPQTAAALLEGLGYYPVVSFQKKRESYELDRTVVTVDELPELGFFMEIEGPDERTIQKVQKKLGLAGQVPVGETYIGMVAMYLATAGGRKSLDFAR